MNGFQKVEFLRGALRVEQFPDDDKPWVLVAGRSNCGKSSLINAMLGRRKIARVSKTPGRTAEINFFLVDDRFYLVDLPGYGYAARPTDRRERWAEIVPALFADPRTVLVLALLDARREMAEEERQVLVMAAQAGTRGRLVLTKCDQVGKDTRNRLAKRLQDEPVVTEPPLATAARVRDGIGEVQAAVLAAVAAGPRQ